MIYKHLKIEDLNKIQERKLIARNARKTFVWIMISISIIICFGIGLFYFYVRLNSNEKFVANTDIENTSEDTKNDIKKVSENMISSSKTSDNNYEFINTDFSEWNKTAPEELIIVNQANPLVNFALKSKVVNGKMANIIAAEHLEDLLEAARQQNINIWVLSAYRTYKHQKKLFENQVKHELENGAKTKEEAENRAKHIVAPPGCSEHELGEAFDFNSVEENFSLSPAYEWLKNNAHKYGFIERYKSDWKKITGVNSEPWHFRFVGTENSEKIKKSGKPLESYVLEMQGLSSN